MAGVVYRKSQQEKPVNIKFFTELRIGKTNYHE